MELPEVLATKDQHPCGTPRGISTQALMDQHSCGTPWDVSTQALMDQHPCGTPLDVNSHRSALLDGTLGGVGSQGAALVQGGGRGGSTLVGLLKGTAQQIYIYIYEFL